MTLERPALIRPRDSVLGGVSAALATHFGAEPWRVRAVFILLAPLLGFGVLLYLWLWATVPLERATTSIGVRRRVPVAGVMLTVSSILLAMIWSGGWQSQYDRWTMLAVLLALAAGCWHHTMDRSDTHRSQSAAAVIRWASGLLPLLTGLGMLLMRIGGDGRGTALGILAIILGAAMLGIPPLVALVQKRLVERAAQARSQQRSEFAAHLHDSVLQTLALIQNRAGASSEIARIARAQERELRDWLFTDSAPTGHGLAAELQAVAEELELAYPVRFDVVATGEGLDEPSPELFAASREAMVNAARHAGGEVSVYLEGAASATEVFVRDRGPGLDMAKIPDGRLGVRESIIGRMARAGGSAELRQGADGSGTEVRLRLPRTGRVKA